MSEPPLPPHERTWRHPSEMSPTAADVDDAGPSRSAFWFGSAAVLAVAFGVVTLAMMPVQQDDISIGSATTLAILDGPALVSPRRAITATEGPAAQSIAFTPLKQTPRHVAAATAPLEPQSTATALPDDDEHVIVLTDDMLYHVPWGALAGLELPVGAVVIDLDGGLLGSLEDGSFVAANPRLVPQD